MNHPGEETVDAPVIDESACRAYVREIRDLLSVDLFALVVDAGGSTLWTDDPNRADQLVQGLRKVRAPDGEASMKAMIDRAKKKERASWQWSVPAPAPLEMIKAGDVIICGFHGEVRAYSADIGHEVWRTTVDGAAHGLAVAGNRLLVSTDRGYIYALEPSR